jgi:hypothetical protein
MKNESLKVKRSPTHTMACLMTMQSLATLMICVEAKETVLSTPEMKELMVHLSEELGGNQVNLMEVVNLWDQIKETYYSGIDPTDDEAPKAIDLCLGAVDEAISLVISYMDRI